jgi:hypothetical protein
VLDRAIVSWKHASINKLISTFTNVLNYFSLYLNASLRL